MRGNSIHSKNPQNPNWRPAEDRRSCAPNFSLRRSNTPLSQRHCFPKRDRNAARPRPPRPPSGHIHAEYPFCGCRLQRNMDGPVPGKGGGAELNPWLREVAPVTPCRRRRRRQEIEGHHPPPVPPPPPQRRRTHASATGPSAGSCGRSSRTKTIRIFLVRADGASR